MNRFIVSALIFLGFVSAAFAQATVTPVFPYNPMPSTGQYGISITSVTTLTVPNGATMAEICVTATAANYTTTGTVPTASAGGGVPVSGCFQLAGKASLSAFKVIGASGAIMSVEYFR